jgi:hypothetical protein
VVLIVAMFGYFGGLIFTTNVSHVNVLLYWIRRVIFQLPQALNATAKTFSIVTLLISISPNLI